MTSIGTFRCARADDTASATYASALNVGMITLTSGGFEAPRGMSGYAPAEGLPRPADRPLDRELDGDARAPLLAHAAGERRILDQPHHRGRHVDDVALVDEDAGLVLDDDFGNAGMARRDDRQPARAGLEDADRQSLAVAGRRLGGVLHEGARVLHLLPH